MSCHSVLKHYVTLGKENQWQMHYRTQGKSNNPAVVLLHPSPLSSASMLPIMAALSDNFYVVAVDTPGYGQSDPLPSDYSDQQQGALSPYVEALHSFIDAINLEAPLIYGSATGAQIAIEYAKAYSTDVPGIVLDNASWFYDDERQAILSQYFPDISPVSDGAHLTLAWKMSRQLFQFFPWYDTSPNARVGMTEMPAKVVHDTVMGYLSAGENYHQAYRAAFLNERPEQLAQVTVATRIIRWSDSLLKQYVDRLDDANLPSNIVMHPAASGIENRYLALQEALLELSNNQVNQG